MENENKQPPVQGAKLSNIKMPKKEDNRQNKEAPKKEVPKKEEPKKITPKRINYNRERSYVKTGVACTIVTALVIAFTTTFISTAKSFNQELVRLYVWICIVLFVVTLLPVLVASSIALIKTSKKYKKKGEASDNKNEKKSPTTKNIIEIVWYSILVVLPILITCLTLTNL